MKYFLVFLLFILTSCETCNCPMVCIYGWGYKMNIANGKFEYCWGPVWEKRHTAKCKAVLHE